MKKIVFLLLTLFICGTAWGQTELDLMEYANDAAAQAAYVSSGIGSDLVTNGGMENWADPTDSPPDDWSNGNPAGDNPYRDATNHSGSYSLRNNKDSDGHLIIQQSIGGSELVGHRIVATAWVKTDTASRGRILLIVDGGTGDDTSSYHTGSGNWEQLTVSGVVGSGATNVVVRCETVNATDTYVYFDDYVAKATNLQSYSESTIVNQGTYSLKGIAVATESLNDTLTRTVSPTIDLSGLDTIKYDIYSASRTGSNIKISIHDSGGTITEHTANISSTGAWETQTWDISGVADADKDAIDQIKITIVNADADNTFYIDNMYAEVVGAGQIMRLILQ